LKKLLLSTAIIVFAYEALPAPLAFVVLNTSSSNAGRLPPDWQIKVNHGKPDVSVCQDSGGTCLHFRSVKSSFSLEHEVDIDPARMPFLSWRWKVSQLPAGGDFRRSTTDDQAAQVLVAFADHRVVSYIWDTSAPKGAVQNSSFLPLIHVFAVVCESGAADANRWIAESRNLAADYERAYGRPAPHVKGLRLQINSQHTGTTAESCFGEVAFRSAPPE